MGFLDLLTSMTLNDLKLPKGFLVNFSQFLDATHISTLNCDEIAETNQDNLRIEIFSIKRRFKQFKSRLHRFKEAGAGGRQRRLPPAP